jgi:AcrR family transcriptional regulator
MRVSKEKAAANRQKILVAAARLFRAQGVNATGVDAITKDAHLTHGVVYSQFGSKEAITAEAIRLAFQGSRRLWRRVAGRKRGRRRLPPSWRNTSRESTGTHPVRAVSSPLLAPRLPDSPTACVKRSPKSWRRCLSSYLDSCRVIIHHGDMRTRSPHLLVWPAP